MANVFSNIGSGKKEEKKTKTKQSNLSSKITINKNTNSKSIQENLNKSSVTNPLSNSTQGSKVKIVNTKLSADTKTSKADKAKVSSNKATNSNIKVSVNNINNNAKTNNTKSDTSNKKTNIFDKYFTAEGVASLDDNSLWKKIATGMDKSNSGNNLMSLNSNNVGSGLSQETKQTQTEVENRTATEKLLNGEKSSKLGNYLNLDTGYQLDDDDKETIDNIGVVVDNRTGKQVDNEYVNKLYSDVDSKYTSINKQIEQLNSDYQNGKLSDNDYKLKYGLLENEWKETDKSAKELKNYKYKSGKEYYEWLKENGTDEEIKSYEAYIGSYDDSMLDSLANSYKATLVDFANTPIEAVEMVRTLVDGDYDFSDDDTLSSNLRSISNELRTYTLNGKNGEGLRKYSLQTISSLMPMINDAIIFTATGGALGWEGKTLEKGVSLLTNLQFGLSSAGETTRQRLNEGNSMEVSMANGIVHGAITGLVEGLNVGNVVNVVNLLTGAGGSVLGVGLLGMPNAVSTIASNLKSGLGESVEEIAESFSDKYADKITNAILSALGSNERVEVADTTWGKVGEEGLTDQCIMAFAGAILLGAPTTISTYIDSKAKYNAAIESKKYWQAAQEYFTKSGDTKNAQDCQSIISLIDQETRTYAINNEKSFAYEKASDVATPAPSVEDVMNMTANAFSLDVSDTIEQAEKNKATATSIFGQLQNELVNRGLFGINDMGTDTKGVDVETYVKMTPELRTKAKNLLTLANELGANYKIDNEFNIIDKNGKLTTMNLTDTQNGAHFGKGATDTVVTNPFSNDAKNNSNILEETLSHEFVHTAKESGNYKNLENAVVKALGSEFESFKNSIKQLYGDKVHTEEELMDEVTAKWVEKNLGSEKFIQQLSNYNTSMFSRLYTGMKALFNIDGKSEVANEFFKSYKDIIDKAKKGTQQTFVGGHAISENGIAFNLSEFDKTGRDILKQYLIDNREGVDASNVENDPLYKRINSYYEMLKDMAESGNFPSFEQWSNWDIEIDEEEKPYFSCVVNNGEYKLNIDFSTVCKKRKVMDAVLNDLATKGILDNRALTPEEITHLREIIKDNGLEVACKLCFVDAKRFNQGGWADSFINGKDVETGKGKNKKVEHVEGWNELVDRLIPEGAEAEEFNFANRDLEKTDTVKLHELSNSEVNQDGLRHLLEIMANTEPNTEIHRMAKALYNKPNLRKKLEIGDLYASTAFMNIKAGDKDFYKLVNGHQGSAKPKIPFLEVRYDNEIIEGHTTIDGQKVKFEPEVARKVGGIRLQSFSDFMINTVFDYMEAIAQMDAKGLTAHSYTKVEDYVRLFGQTGMKINMSIIPKVADISDELKTFIKDKLTQKKTGALKPESSLSNRVKNDPMYQEYLKAKSTAGLGIMSIEEYNSLDAKEKERLTKENSLKLSEDGSHYSYYLFDDESFNWLTAKEIQDTEGYDANCGTICVGVSDEHIWKLLSDPDVKMVIPYHKSSLNPVVAQMMNIGLYNDYTTKQNTRYANGTKLDPKDNTFDFYADETYGMIATGYDVQKTTEGYLRWCSENNYLPKFDTFAYVKKNGGGWSLNEDGTANYVGLGKGDYTINENYYKTLIDFRAYDSKGNLAPQQEVKLNMPSNFSEIVKNGLQEHDVALGKQSETYPKIEQEFEDYINNGVHYSLSTDTDGRKLSDSQKEYFKNSKMVDENGNLKVMYHGTTDSNFTVFDSSYSDDGISLFFTDSPEIATTYSGIGAEGGNDSGDPKEYQFNYNPPILNNVDDANRYLREIDLQLEGNQKPKSPYFKSYNVEFNESDGIYHIFETKTNMADGLELGTKEDITDDLIKRAMVERKTYTVGKMSLQEVKDTFNSLDNVVNAIRNEAWEEKGNYETYLNLENPLIVDADFNSWKKVPFDMPYSDRESRAFTTREISEYAYNNGYDGVIFENLYDIGGWGMYMDSDYLTYSTVAIAFNSNQIKAVNNRVPTSDNDIRYDLGQEYDSNGRQLSDEQKKYFKYSKVRTPNGDMLVMYHGTNAGFTEFDSSKIGTHGAFEGSGFNFTSSESRAKEYANGGNVMEGYLNITNPLSTTEKTISVEELADIIKRVDPMGDDIISGYATNTSDYGTQEFVDRESLNVAKTIFEHANSDADIYSDLSSVGGSVELMNAFKEMGYDGVIHYNLDGNIQTAVIFDSNQMKNINNLNPTINSDIRYSFQDDLNKIKERNEIDAANEMLGIDDAYWESLYETVDQLEGNATKEVKLDDVKNGNTHVREDMKTKRPTHTIKEDANRIIKNFVNKSKYIWDLSRNTKNENIYPLYNQYMNSRSVADRMLYKKGGWADIINEIPKDMQNDFSYMVYHGVNIDAAKYNKNVFKDYTSEQSEQIVSQYLLEHPEWQSTWNKVLDYENMLKQKLVDSGRISQATADKWGEMYPHYVHVVRIMDDTDVKETADPKVKSSNSGTVKERKGGRQDIKSLNDAITEQTYQVARGTSLNEFAKEYAKISHANVSNEFANIMNFQQTIDSLADVGDVLKAADENTPAQLVYYDDGDLMVMDIPNELYEVFENNNKLPNNKITQGLNKVNDFRRNLITGWNLTFSVRNIIKDTQDMFYKSNHPLATFVNLPKAMVGLAMSDKSSNSKLYQLAEDWRDLGGGSGNYTQLHEGSTFFNNTIGRIERLNNYIESVPRFAEFMASLEKGRTPTQAMYDSDKVTTNFKMGGEYTKWLDRNGFTFLNASVEGFNEIIQSYESAYDNKGWKGVVGKMAISTLVLNVPLMILNHLLWKDDDDYQDLSDYVKDNYYIIFKMKDGKFFRIPKGRIAAAYQGVLDSIYDSGVELVSDDSATEKAKTLWENSLDAIKNTWDNIGVNNPFTNNILAPIFQVANNETWYGEAIESESDLKKAPAQRYDYSTDTFSKWVGENLNLSPKKINYLLDQYSGGIGDVVLPMLTPKAESGLDDGTVGGKIASALLSPAVNDFTTDPVFKNQNVSDLFTLSEELTQQANREDATDDQKIANKYITTIKNQMFELYGERADIFNDSSLSDSEKYRQARVVQQQIDELAKTGINTYDQLDIQGNYASVNGYGYYKDGDDWKMVDSETMDEMNSLNMNMAQRETFYNLKEEITSNNKVKTLLGYYEQKENLKESTYSDSIKAAKLEELDKKIANAEKKFTETELTQIKQKGTIDSKTLNYESIKDSNLTDEQKNYVYDQYYDSTVGTYINDLDISDADKFELKYAVSTATGVKDSKGNTISNTKALAVANAYASLGVLDDVFEYINNYGLSPSEMGLSKTLMGWSYTTMASKYKQYFGQEFGSRTSDASNVISSPETGTYSSGSSGKGSGSGSSSTSKQLKAMKAYMSALTSNNNIFSALDNMTTIDDAKKNVEEILKDAYKG